MARTPKKSNGEPRITGMYKRGNVYWFTRMVEGRRVQVSLETTDPREAVDRAMEVRANPFLHSSDPFGEEIERFLAYKLKRGEYTQRSAQAKRYPLKELAAFVGKADPANVTTADLQRFYEHLLTKANEGTSQGYLMTARSFYNWLLGRNVVRSNPAAGVEFNDLPKVARDRFCEAVHRDELIANAPSEHLRFVLYCGFHAGLRKNEIIEARPEWFDLERGTLHVKDTPTFRPKDKEARYIPLTQAFQSFLREYGLRSPFMLRPERKHRKATYRYNFEYPLKKYVTAQGCEWVTAHVMRHTFASQLAIAGVSIFKIAKWLGDDVRTTQEHYAKLLPADDDIEKAFS